MEEREEWVGKGIGIPWVACRGLAEDVSSGKWSEVCFSV